jgi:hypothetical protein
LTSPLSDLLAASRFTRVCLLGPGYHFPDEIALALDFSEHGDRLRAEVKEKFPDLAEGDISAGLLAAFAASDNILVNAESSSVDKIFQILSKEIRERRMNYPLIFGRALHDQFIDNFGATPIQKLTPEQTQRLVAMTPQGIFQMEEWVSGPFGLIKSAGRRYLPPQNCGPVIRCTLVSCNALHHISMQTSPTDASKAYSYTMETAPTSVEMSTTLTDILLPDDEYFRVNHPGGLPWLLGNGFTHDEVTRLAEHVLSENIGGLRQLANNLIGGSAAKRAPTVLLGTLSHPAIIQLLLLLDDVQLVNSIEDAIDGDLIRLSPTEVRRSFENRHLNGGRFGVDAEASRLGVRFIPERNMTEPRMLALIREVFSGPYEGALRWQLRNEPGGDSLYKLERCLEDQDPRDLLARILFSAQDALERTFEVLKYGRFELPATSEAEQSLLQKILWKLGSPLPTPPPPYAALEQFMSQILISAKMDQANEESRITAIRNIGMNMFVALEALLRSCSDFSCWALLNDHYDLHPFDRFRYFKSHGEDFALGIFGEEAKERGAAFPYNPTGGNTLSVLIASFRVLAEVCEARLVNPDSYIRPDWQVPTFANHSDVQNFPLLHTTLFLDLRPDCQQRLIDSLRAVTLTLTRVDVCEIRNSLGHPRETFPSNETIVEAVQAIRNALGVLVSEGLAPVIRKYSGESIDKFNRRRIRVADGDGNEVSLAAPNQLMLLNLPPYLVPQIVVLDAFFAGSLQPARFEVSDDSAWADMWHDVGLINSWLNRSESTVIPDEVAVDADADGIANSGNPAASATLRLY